MERSTLAGLDPAHLVGGSAQTKAVKAVSGNLRLSLAQFRELASFAQFGSDLDAETKARIDRGQRLTELLKQPQYQPLAIWQQVVSVVAVTSGALDEVPVNKVHEVVEALLARFKTEQKDAVKSLNNGDKPDEKLLSAVKNLAEKSAKEFN